MGTKEEESCSIEELLVHLLLPHSKALLMEAGTNYFLWLTTLMLGWHITIILYFIGNFKGTDDILHPLFDFNAKSYLLISAP
jgi:hypothetical protein